jgi:hypothetical protein
MKKLNIKVGNEWLDMPQDAKTTYRKVSNIFFDGTKQRERSTQLRLPATSKNSRILNYLQMEGTINNAVRVMNC